MERAYVFVIGRQRSGAHQIQGFNTDQSEKKSPTIASTKINKGYRGASSTRFWPTWTHPHFPNNVPQCLLSSSLKPLSQAVWIKMVCGLQRQLEEGWLERQFGKTLNLAGTSYLPHISKDEKWYLPCCITLLLSHHRPPFPATTRAKCSPDVSAIELQYFTNPASVLSTVSKSPAW